jgi:MoaA/NifB/PqqE/SkfB family radical SAM enzyme
MSGLFTIFRKKLEEARRREELKKIRKRMIANGDLKIWLDDANRLRLHYKGVELAKSYGLSSSILSEGIWYHSQETGFDVEKISENQMRIFVSFPDMPIRQEWLIKIDSRESISCEINTELTDSLRIDRVKVDFLISKSYSRLVYQLEDAVFPQEFNALWNISGSLFKDNFIGCVSLKPEYPSICLRSTSGVNNLFGAGNTDSTLSSRVLEAQVEETDEYLKPGTYEHFKIHIQLYPDKTVLENILSKIRTQKQLEEEEARRKQEELKKKQLGEETEKRILEYFKEYPADLFSGKVGLVHLYGDSDKLHDKISGVPGDFIKIIGKIKKIAGKGILYIGVSRYNFFRLHTIAQYAATLMGQRIDLRSLGVTFLPVRNLYASFGIYLNELNQHLSQHRIHLYLKDAGLLELLHTMSSQADQYNERDLLRLLGVIAEHPFIGPQTIVLDTYHRCNTDCLHCWIHTPKRKIIGRIENLEMDINLYKQIIDDAERVLCDEIIIQGDGEPMLDSRFMEMIAYARNKGLKTLFFTNGILLDKKKAAGIVDLEVNEIFCSLPAGTAKTYALINSKQSENTFSVIENNLKNLINMRNNAGRSKPLLQMTHVIHNLNYHEMEEMARLDASIGADKVRFYLVRLDNNIKFLKLKASHIKSMQESLQRIEPLLKAKGIELQDNIHFQLQHYNPENGDWSGETFSNMGCPVGWFFSLALFRGEVSMCCHLRIIDILKEKSFTQIWNSDRYNEVRIYAKYLNKHKNEHLLNGKKLFDDSCRHCDTHQVILRINQLMNKYHLDKFYQESFL